MTPDRWAQILFDLDSATDSEIDSEGCLDVMRGDPAQIHISVLDILVELQSDAEKPCRQRLAGCCAMLPFRADTFSPLPRRHEGLTVNYKLSPEVSYTDGPLEADFEIDFGVGSGARTLAFGESAIVNYPAEGTHTATATWTGPGGKMTAAFDIAITDPRAVAPAPDESWPLTATYAGKNYAGTASVWYGDGQTAVDKAVVFAQPFADLEPGDLYDALNALGAVDKIRGATPAMSVILITYGDYTDPIQANAMVVIDGLKKLLAVAPRATKHAFGGVSMGALVIRYALTYWEHKGLTPADANGEVYFSWDGPNFCACLPLSVQWQMLFWESQSSDAKDLVRLLHSPASSQMLFYNVASASGGKVRNPGFDAFWNDIWNLGGYPQNLTKVAVANGDGSGGQVLTPSELNVTVRGYSGPTQLANAFSSNDPKYSSSATSLAKGWAMCKMGPKTMAATYIIGFTDAPGGLRDSFQVLGDTLKDSMEKNSQLGKATETVVEGSHAFVPTFSALDMFNVSDPFEPLAGQKSNFDHFLYSSTNTGHATITAELQTWFLQTVFGITAKEAGEPSVRFTGFSEALAEGELTVLAEKEKPA